MNNIPRITKNLLIINVIFFLGMFVAEKYKIDLTDILGLHFFLASDFQLYQFITYMFMHANFEHIFFNMFSLFMFGPVLERYWGEKRFLIFYFVCGIGAGLSQELVQYIHYSYFLSAYTNVDIGTSIISMNEYLNMITTVGASGAIYGILLAFGLTYPNIEMFVFPLPFPVKAKYFVIFCTVIEIVLGLASGDGVAHTAHLGGMAFGLVLTLYWKQYDKKHGWRHYE